MASMGLAQVIDPRAGIEITLPTAMVEFTRYEAPFAHYEGDDGVRVVLISQRGDRATLWGLYDILQTLSVVPPEGAAPARRHLLHHRRRERPDHLLHLRRARRRRGEGLDADLAAGRARCWTPKPARWLREDDRRLGLVLDAMRDSFASLGAAALDDNAGLDTATQSIDLVSGLEIRRPEKSRSGFYVSDTGAVLTTTEAVAGCGRITLDEAYESRSRRADEALGARAAAAHAAARAAGGGGVPRASSRGCNRSWRWRAIPTAGGCRRRR